MNRPRSAQLVGQTISGHPVEESTPRELLSVLINALVVINGTTVGYTEVNLTVSAEAMPFMSFYSLLGVRVLAVLTSLPFVGQCWTNVQSS